MASCSPDCSISRSAAMPEAKSGKNQESARTAFGTRRIRTVASVMMPSVPSEPTNSWRGFGPAAVAGVVGSSMGPLGVEQRRPWTFSSMRP